MKYLSTLDIDTNDKHKIKDIEDKIRQCKSLISLEKRPSSTKGFHFILYCVCECDICRFCYDDFKRFAYDQHRPKYMRNILFTEKVPFNKFVKEVLK